MEFNEKLQELRNKKGLTQEELGEQLFVSRTAISKWESGRGYPNIDSLKAIATFFSVSIDELLSGEEILLVAEKENFQKQKHIISLVFGLLDISISFLFFLPFFAQKAEGIISSVPLLTLTAVSPYLKAVYLAFVTATVIFGILLLAMQNCKALFWNKNSLFLSLALSAATTALFIISLQPYAAIFSFLFAAIKVFLIMTRRVSL